MVKCIKIFIILFLFIQVAPSVLILAECDSELVSNSIEKEENKEIDSEYKSEFIFFCSNYYTNKTHFTSKNNFKKYLLKECQFSQKKQLLPPEKFRLII